METKFEFSRNLVIKKIINNILDKIYFWDPWNIKTYKRYKIQGERRNYIVRYKLQGERRSYTVTF